MGGGDFCAISEPGSATGKKTKDNAEALRTLRFVESEKKEPIGRAAFPGEFLSAISERRFAVRKKETARLGPSTCSG
jgi:hypothetical protein